MGFGLIKLNIKVQGIVFRRKEVPGSLDRVEGL